MQKADGTYRWHLLRAEARSGDNKESIGWFGTFLDIEDRKQIEEINKADQAKSRFLASMSHGKHKIIKWDLVADHNQCRDEDPTFWCNWHGFSSSHYPVDKRANWYH
jgi:hypothetical protein